MPRQSTGVILSMCEKCGYKVSSAFLVGGKCKPCRDWRDTSGPQTACFDTKNKTAMVPPPAPKVTRTISVKKALERAKAAYQYVPRFVINIIRANTKRSGKTERFPVCKLPVKLHRPRKG